ncbi:MAG: DUF4388 domain-containing protein [Deltaproteobacteria bacterium]|nr:DUF4388 domain-containing protein [Deltaproteobacteria bacterium]
MALKGTLKDFGIADIFQLISHQSKTGVLHLETKGQEVRVSFSNGDVVRAESTTRRKRDLLGSMLVRAEVVSQAQLEQALGIQKRTLKRLGDILVEKGFLTRDELKEFTHLQTTETVYKLFNWETGTYAFEPEEVQYDKRMVDPLRSENVLMEGFRMVDEWPMIRKRITSYELTFRRVKELSGAAVTPKAEDEIDSAFDDMFSEGKPAKSDRPKCIGANEEKVYNLIEDDRDVQKLIDLSRLGEFETCKALLNLINESYIKIAGKIEKADAEVSKEKPGGRVRRLPIGRIFIQAGMYVLIVGLCLVLYRLLEGDVLSLFRESSAHGFQSPVALELIDRNQSLRVENALEVYRLETGSYPDGLAQLVEEDLLSETDLRFPWRTERAYQRRADGFLVLRPFE